MTFKLSEKVFTSLKKSFEGLTKAYLESTGASQVCYGAVYSANTGAHYSAGHFSCHSWLPRVDTEDSLVVLTCHNKERKNKMRGSVSDEAMDEILLWLAKESPYKDYILNADDDSLLEHGPMILMGGKEGLNRNETMWVCKVLRYATEGGSALNVWLELKKRGVDPLVALMSASFIREISKDGKCTYTGAHTHSTVFLPIQRYQNGKYVQQDLPTFQELLNPVRNVKADQTQGIFLQNPTIVVRKPNDYGYDYIPGVKRFKEFCVVQKMSDGWGGFKEVSGVHIDDLSATILKLCEENTTLKSFEPTKDTVYLEIDV